MKFNLHAQISAFLMAGVAVVLTSTACEAQGYTITTFAGGGDGSFDGLLGDGGPATGALIPNPYGMAMDSAGNVYIADNNFSVVRKVTPSGIISTIAGIVGYVSGEEAGYSGDGGPATKAQLNFPQGLAIDSVGNLYIADSLNFRIRKVAPNGVITTVAGTGTPGLSTDGTPAVQAAIYAPHGITSDGIGNLYFADGISVRKISATGAITTIVSAFTATLTLTEPTGIAVDSSGNVYFSDQYHNTIRKVTPAGVMTTVAGNGAGSYQGDGGPATSAGFYKPDGVAVDGSGNIFIADTGDNRVRMVSTNGTVATIAGTGDLQTSGDGGPASGAGLCNPSGILLGGGAVIYLADESSIYTPNLGADGRVRKLIPSGGSSSPPSIKSGGVVGASAFGQFTSVAPGSWIEIYGTNLASDSRSWSETDFNGVNAPTQLDGTTVAIGGQNAFIDYISPTQVNAQIPSNTPTGMQPVVVTKANGTSTAFSIVVNAERPGLLSPSSFNIGGKQYAAALFSDGVTYVVPSGAIPVLPSRPAKPGDSITFYGVGFGPVIPNIPAGQIVQQSNSLAASFQLTLGGMQASVPYHRLAPNAVGLYQFNVVVPNIPVSGAVPLTFALGGIPGPQTLYLAVTSQ